MEKKYRNIICSFSIFIVVVLIYVIAFGFYAMNTAFTVTGFVSGLSDVTHLINKHVDENIKLPENITELDTDLDLLIDPFSKKYLIYTPQNIQSTNRLPILCQPVYQRNVLWPFGGYYRIYIFYDQVAQSNYEIKYTWLATINFKYKILLLVILAIILSIVLNAVFLLFRKKF